MNKATITQELYDRLIAVTNTSWGTGAYIVQEYSTNAIAVTASIITTPTLRDIMQEFEHCYYDGDMNSLVVRDAY